MHQTVTAKDIARLEALSVPSNSFVRHEKVDGSISRLSRESDIQGIVTRGHRALQKASNNLGNSMSEASRHTYRHVVDVENIKEQMNDAAIGWREAISEDIEP